MKKDFKLFKNSRKKNMEKTKKDLLLDSMAKKDDSYDDPRMWKLSRDKNDNGNAIIRFLDAYDETETPIVKIYSHAFKDVGGWYIENCRTTLGYEEKDPVCVANMDLWNSDNSKDKDIASSRSRKTSFYSNILVIRDQEKPENNGKVFLFRYGVKIHEKIMEAIEGDSFEEKPSILPFDYYKGADFKLAIRKVKGQFNYDNSKFLDPKPLFDGDDEQIEAVFQQTYSLKELVSPDKFKSYDDLQKRFIKVTGGNTSTVSNYQSTETPVETPTTENNELSYLQQLADSTDIPY